MMLAPSPRTAHSSPVWAQPARPGAVAAAGSPVGAQRAAAGVVRRPWSSSPVGAAACCARGRGGWPWSGDESGEAPFLSKDASRLRQPDCKPSSVSPRRKEDGHLSGTAIARGLLRPTRGRAGRPMGPPKKARPPIRSCSGWGLPSRPVTRPLVRSYRTVSPLPSPIGAEGGLSLWHFPSRRRAWELPSTLPGGARTFLPESRSRRPSVLLAYIF